MPAGDIPQRERRVAQTYLVEHEYATLAKLFAGKKQNKLKKNVAKKSNAPAPTKKLAAAPKGASPAAAIRSKGTTKKVVAKAVVARKAVTATKTRAAKRIAPLKKAPRAAAAIRKKAKGTLTKPAVTRPKPTPAKRSPAAPSPRTKKAVARVQAPKPSPPAQLTAKAVVPLLSAAGSPFADSAPLLRMPPQERPPQHIVKIRTLAGKRFCIPIVPESTTVGQLKQQVAATLGIPVDQQRLIGAGRELLPDEAPLYTLGIRADAHVYALPRLRESKT
jgi:hypothetical protein